MIAEILKAQRKERGLTQQEAAKIFHVTRQTISNWENEKNYPDIPTLVAISDYYEVSLDYLMKGDVKYMAKIKKEAKLLQSFQVGLFSVICAAAFFICWICSSDQWRESSWNHSYSAVVNDRYGLGMCDPLQKPEG